MSRDSEQREVGRAPAKFRSLDYYRSLFEQARDAILVADDEGNYVDANPAACRMLGYSLDEITQMDVYRLAPHVEREVVEDAWKHFLEVGETSGEWEVVCKDGSRKTLTFSAMAQVSPGVHVSHLRDVTEQRRAEDAALETATFLAETGRIARVGGWKLDAETRNVTWSEEIFRLYDLPVSDEPPLDAAMEFIHPKDRARLEKAIDRALSDAEPYDLQLRLTTATGRQIWTRSICTPVERDGRVVELVGAFQDISDRKEAEQQLEGLVEDLRLAVRTARLGMWRLDVKTERLEWNDVLFEIFAADPAEFTYELSFFRSRVHPDDLAKIDKPMAAIQAGQDVFGVEYRAIRPDGEMRYVRASGRSVFDSHGELSELIGVNLDVTEFRRSEQALRESEGRFRAMMEQAPVGICLLDRDGTLQSMNQALIDTFAFPAEAVESIVGHCNIFEFGLCGLGRNELKDVQEGHPVFVAPHLEDPAAYLRKKGIDPGSTRPRWVATHLFPLTDTEDRIHSLATIVQDVTEQKLLENQLRQAQKMEAVGQLTGGIAHDFNNELSIILMSADMIGRALQLQPPVASYLQEIHDAGERASNVTRQLLGFSRQAELQPVPVDLHEIVNDFAGTLRSLLPESIAVRVEPGDPVGIVMVDRNSVGQILLNLATNSRDAMPDGGELRLAVRETRGSDDNELAPDPLAAYACLEVSDTGVGMDEDTLLRAFDPFFTTKPTGVGTGLGLSMTFGLVKQQGGFVKLDSSPGAGTTTRIHFPLFGDHTDESGSQEAESHPPGGGTETILLVEDEEPLRKVTRDTLILRGYRVLTATDGRDGLRVFEENLDKVDLILCDAVMPNLNGLEMYESVRSLRPEVPLILMSGYTGRERSSRSLPEGAAFLQKPYRIANLFQAIRRKLDEAKHAPD